MEEQKKSLWAALARAQSKIKEPKHDKINSFFKSPANPNGTPYASIAAVWESIREPMTTEGLSIIQGTLEREGKLELFTKLTHESGDYYEFFCPIIADKQNMQGLGSAITYARRYSLNCIAGTSGEGDDDGNAASGDKKTETAQAQQNSATDKISEAQLGRFHAIKSKANWSDEEAKAYCSVKYGISSSKDILKKDYNDICSYIEKNPKGAK